MQLCRSTVRVQRAASLLHQQRVVRLKKNKEIVWIETMHQWYIQHPQPTQNDIVMAAMDSLRSLWCGSNPLGACGEYNCCIQFTLSTVDTPEKNILIREDRWNVRHCTWPHALAPSVICLWMYVSLSPSVFLCPTWLRLQNSVKPSLDNFWMIFFAKSNQNCGVRNIKFRVVQFSNNTHNAFNIATVRSNRIQSWIAKWLRDGITRGGVDSTLASIECQLSHILHI